MSSRDYERLPIEEFGRQLLIYGDLDPVYIALTACRGQGMSSNQMHRWLIAYWCFYHCGLASYASERSGDGFFAVLLDAATNSEQSPVGGRWPRGHERRHARGAQGIRMVLGLQKRYSGQPERFVRYLYQGEGVQDFSTIADRVKEHTLFGPWIAFKICDMLERVVGCPISFEEAHVFMFKDPVKAAIMLWKERAGLADSSAMPKDQGAAIATVVDYLTGEFQDHLAPPTMDRPVGLQEVETILCKWKSHMNGHYPLFNDIDEIRLGLEGWGDTALMFESCLPAGSEG